MNLERELELAKKLALEAGQAIMEIYNNGFAIEHKADQSPVTTADIAANNIIVTGLKEQFPDYAILAEESADSRERLGNDWCWLVDPLDGTKEFIKKNGEFTVNIALAWQHRVVLGVVYAPVINELYYAAKGNGAFLEKNGVPERIAVSDRLQDLRVVMSRSHAGEREQNLLAKNAARIASVLQSGSALKGCLVARGAAEVYFRFSKTMEWDTAAMQCVVEEAGGILRENDGQEMLYNRENSRNDKGFYVLNRSENKLEI